MVHVLPLGVMAGEPFEAEHKMVNNWGGGGGGGSCRFRKSTITRQGNSPYYKDEWVDVCILISI